MGNPSTEVQVRMRSMLRKVLQAILLTMIVCSPAVGRVRPAMSRLAKTAAETRKKLKDTPATWTAVLQVSGSLPVTVEVLPRNFRLFRIETK